MERLPAIQLRRSLTTLRLRKMPSRARPTSTRRAAYRSMSCPCGPFSMRRNSRPLLRCASAIIYLSSAVGSGDTHANYAESIKCLPLWIAGKTNRIGIARWTAYSPDESGSSSREKGLSRSGNARVRRGMIQLAWRFLDFQKESALAKWFEERTKNARGSRKKMIVALARKLLIALWHFVRDGVVPEGVALRPAH